MLAVLAMQVSHAKMHAVSDTAVSRNIEEQKASDLKQSRATAGRCLNRLVVNVCRSCRHEILPNPKSADRQNLQTDMLLSCSEAIHRLMAARLGQETL